MKKKITNPVVMKLSDFYQEMKKNVTNNFKEFLTLLLLIFFSVGLVNARSIKLTKTGGGSLIYNSTNIISTIYYSNPGFIVPTFPSSGEMIFNEGSTVNSSKNWTDEFNLVSDAINNDPESLLGTVNFKIEIESDNSFTPMLVGKQISLSGFLLAGKAVLEIGKNSINRVKNVTVKNLIGTSNAYIKFINGLLVGSFLPPGYTLNFYHFIYSKPGSSPIEINTTYVPTSLPTTWNPLYISAVTSVSYTNSGTFNLSLDDVPINPNSVWINVSNLDILCTGGYFINCLDVDNFNASNIIVDGNNTNSILGGVYGDVGIQVPHTGLNLYECNDALIVNCEFNNFVEDGIDIYGFPTENIKLSYCKCKFNGRQGLSWLNGNHVSAEYCEFSNTGKAYSGLKEIAFAPASGIDIEPDNSCTDGNFIHCILNDNTGFGIINDGQNYNAYDIKFNDVTINQASNIGLKVLGKKFQFDNCHFNCLVRSGYEGSTIGEETIFNDCYFEDKPFNGIFLNSPEVLFESFNPFRLQFNGCHFKVNDMKREFLKLNHDGGVKIKDDWAIIKDCSFQYSNDGNTSTDADMSLFRQIRFQGNNIFKSDNINCSTHGFILQECMLEGSDLPCSPNKISVIGHIDHYFNYINENFDIGKKLDNSDGYASYIIGDGALLAVSSQSSPTTTNINININSKSSLEIAPEGSLYSGGIYNLEGAFIAKKNSHISFTSPHQFNNLGPNSLLYIDQLCNQGNITVNDFWSNNLTCSNTLPSSNNNWISTTSVSSGTCVQGGNAYIDVNGFAICSPPYNNISTNGAFPVMYKLITTSGGTNLEYTPAGLPDYSVTLDGVITNTNPIVGVADGCHTLVVTNTATGCGTVAFITIGNLASPCCEATISDVSNFLSYSNETSSTIIAQHGTTISNKTIFINGTLTIDQSITFIGCTFLMRSGSSIIVNAGQILFLNTDTLKASCSSMWDGIYASTSTSQINLSNCILQDMENGIVSLNGARINCQSNTFIDNFVGMRFENSPAGYVSVGGNKGVVLNNKYTSRGNNLLPPHQNEAQSCTGINILNCKELEIGELVYHSNNLFNTIRTGINVMPKANDNNIIRILNNSFTNIHKDFSGYAYPEEELTKKFYTKDKGAGIFVPNGNSPNSSNTRILHVEALPNDGKFENCDKAVVGNNISANVVNCTIRNCKGGILFNDARAQRYWVESNNIDNAFLGIQLIGDLQRATIVNHMSTFGAGIYTQQEPILIDPTQNNNVDRTWPKGIDIKFTNQLHMGEVLIDNNTIHLKGIGGKGISTFLTGPMTTVRNNQIEFVTNDETDDPEINLVGIQSLVSLGNQIKCNTVSGVYSNSVWQKRSSQGLLFYESGQARNECNSVQKTWHGNLVCGNCITDPSNIIGNHFNKHSWGMLFVPSILTTSEGSFGDIGNQSADNNNQFNGTYSNPNGYNLYRYCLPGNSMKNYIYTNQSILSGAYGGWSYQPQQAPNPYDCLSSKCLNNDIDPKEVFINEERAEDLVNENVSFPYFPEISQWVAENKLFRELDKDSNLRTSNYILDSFYLQRIGETMGDILATDKAINLLSDSISGTDTTIFSQRLQNAISSNNSINSIHNYEQNERIVNELNLKVNSLGRELLTSFEISQLEILAKSCPAIEGTAVYKARTLYTMYEPTLDYNDYIICATSNKNDDNFLNNIYNLLNTEPNTISETQSSELVSSIHKPIIPIEFSISPNPASDMINIIYDFKNNVNAELIFYDMLGQKVTKTLLPSTKHIKLLSVLNLPVGLYSYCVQIGNEKYNGKISISR